MENAAEFENIQRLAKSLPSLHETTPSRVAPPPGFESQFPPLPNQPLTFQSSPATMDARYADFLEWNKQKEQQNTSPAAPAAPAASLNVPKKTSVKKKQKNSKAMRLLEAERDRLLLETEKLKQDNVKLQTQDESMEVEPEQEGIINTYISHLKQM